MEEGIQEGERKSSLKIAKKLKNKGMNIEEIIEITGLKKEEIEEI